MNDKQQLAAMGVQCRLTEEQAKVLAKRMPQTGALQILDDEPLRMAKRIEELDKCEPFAWSYEWASCITSDGPQNFKAVIEREAPPQWAIDEGQARKVVPLYTTAPAVPEGWQLVPVDATPEMLSIGALYPDSYADMLAAAPKPEAK